MATVIHELAFTAFIPGGATHTWWSEPVDYGDIHIFTAQATPRRGPHGEPIPFDRIIQVVDVFYITKPSNSIQVNVRVQNLIPNGYPYEIFLATIKP